MMYWDGSNFILGLTAAILFIGLFVSLIVNIELWQRLQTLRSAAGPSSETGESPPFLLSEAAAINSHPQN